MSDSYFLAPEMKQMDFQDWNSPIIQASQWSPLDQYPWQNAVWKACWRQGASVAVRTANGSGKSSYVVPILALSFASAFPGSQCVITSNTEAQLKQQLWPAIQQMAVPLQERGWKITKELITAPSVDGMRGSEIIMRVTKQGENFEGYHEKTGLIDNKGNKRYGPLMIIADEAKSIGHEIFEAMGRCSPDVLLYISTTGEDAGDFYDACMNVDGTWTTQEEYDGMMYEFVIDWEQCPHLQEGFRKTKFDAMINKLGLAHPYVKSRLLAQFARGSDFQVFSDSDLQKARNAMQKHAPCVGTQQKAFCDFSGGGDELTFGYRRGNDIDPIVAWTRDSEMVPSEEAEKYVNLYKSKQLVASQIFGDNGGVGQPIISEIHKRHYQITRVNPNVPAKEKDQFVDRYTEMHWEFKRVLQEGMLRLPYDEKLLDQMRRRRYVMRNGDDNRIRMEPKPEAKKKRKEKSPDRLDTIVGLISDMEDLPTARQAIKPSTACGTPKEYMEQLEKERLEGGEDGEGGNYFMGGWAGI